MLSNVSEKSTFQIRQNYPAPVGFFAGAGFGKSAGFRRTALLQWPKYT